MSDATQDTFDHHEDTPCPTCRGFGGWYETAEGEFIGWSPADCDDDDCQNVTCEECDGVGRVL